MSGNISKIDKKLDFLLKMGLAFILTLVVFYYSAGAIIRRISVDTDFPDLTIRILTNFERNLIDYQKSDKRKQDPVIVGPSYAAHMGNPKGGYNLGLVSGFCRETEYIIEKYCRSEDRILYIVNIHEGFNLDKEGKILRPEVRNCFVRRFTIFRALCRQMLLGSADQREEETEGAVRPRPYSFEDIRHVINNAQASEGQVRRFEYWVVHTRDMECVPEKMAVHYSELVSRHPNITYVFLPIMPDLRDDSNNIFLNRTVKRVVRMEKQLLEELEEKGVEYIDLRNLGLSNLDYIDICHLKKSAYDRVLTYLEKEGYVAKQTLGVGN